MKLTEGSKGFEKHPAGTPVCTLIRIVDMGSQEVNWQGASKLSHKIMFVWESTETMSDGRPYIVSRNFTASLNSKGNLRPFLEGWRGRAFTDQELSGFDPKVLVGMPCILNLVEDGEYTNVNSAMRLPKGMEPPKIVNDTVYFSLAEYDQKEFDKLSDKIKEKIMSTPEYKSIKGESQPGSIPKQVEDDIAF